MHGCEAVLPSLEHTVKEFPFNLLQFRMATAKQATAATARGSAVGHKFVS